MAPPPERSMRLWTRLAVIGVVTWILAACGSAVGGTPSASIVETPSPNEAEAIRFRTSAGFRADVPYVRLVAASADASSLEFSIPLLPAEIAELNARAANADAVRDAIDAYTRAHPDEFAGLYLDQEHGGGAVTTLWTGHLDKHAAAIRALVRPGARIAFRQATFTYRDLRAFQDRISSDWDWMRGFEIAPMGVGVDMVGNRVELDVSSAATAAPAIVAAHYGNDAVMLTVVSDGTGAALIGRGTVRGRALDAEGKPPGDVLARELALQWTSDGPGDCGGGDIGYGLNGDGSFELPCQAGGHTIEVQIGVPDDGWRTIGSGHVIAVADGVVNLAIRLDVPWPSPEAR
jgi:hypothetical protein